MRTAVRDKPTAKKKSKSAPAIAEAPKDEMEAPTEQPPPASDEVSILIVDDKPDKLAALEAVLIDLDASIVKASSGKEALRILLQRDFAVILLDVHMPIMDGFETAELIRQRERSEHTPIIFVTSISTNDTYIHKGYALGAVDYIFTPIVPQILRAKVAVFVELVRKTKEIQRQGEQLRQIKEREHARKLEEAREKLEIETTRNRFFTLALDMLGISGFDGVLKQTNPTWEKVLGWPENELKAKAWMDFVHPEDARKTEKIIEKLKGGSDPIYFENRFLCSDGSYKWLGWNIAPFVSEQLLYLFARDITERKRVEQALQETNTELESFSYTVSHDLRAPLRAMQGFADALLQDYAPQLDKTALDYAKRIVSAAQRMDALIQDLLVYSRLNRSELPIDKIDLKDAFAAAMEQLEGEVKKRNAKIVVQDELGEACGHFATMVQVVVNLLSNAIKFVAPGQDPVVTLRSEQVDGNIKLYVEDNGIGIPAEYHSRVFRVFERLHGADAYPGTGIGLAIVRKGMERMGGRVGLISEPSKGSCFCVELPLPGTAVAAAGK